MKNNTFVALNVPVLNFSYDPDGSNSIIPPEAFVTFKPIIPITYGRDDAEVVIGEAKLQRKHDQLLADMTLRSGMKDVAKALRLLRKLYPATGFIVTEAHHNVILKLEIFELFLTPYGNQDTLIEPLGARVSHLLPKKDMH